LLLDFEVHDPTGGAVVDRRLRTDAEIPPNADPEEPEKIARLVRINESALTKFVSEVVNVRS